MNLDCSGFVYYYFTQTNRQKGLNEVRDFIRYQKGLSDNEIKRIYASEYGLFFEHLKEKKSNYWQLLSSPAELCQDDLIIYLSDKQAGNHCMLVHTLLNTSACRLLLEVVDSSQFRHANDTRQKGKMGIGRGQITLAQDKSGVWNRLKWNKLEHKGRLFFARCHQD